MVLHIPIVYESEDFLVLDKPCGLVSNRSASQSGFTVQDFLQNYLLLPTSAGDRSVASEFVLRSGLVHRLDKDTSGVLLAAKTERAFNYGLKLFKDRTIEKTYQAVVLGWLPDSFRVDRSSNLLRNAITRTTLYTNHGKIIAYKLPANLGKWGCFRAKTSLLHP